METKHVISIKDEKRTKSINFKFPHLMNSESEQEVRTEYEALLEKKEELYQARDVVRTLEKELSLLEKQWQGKRDLFDIEFETIEKEVTTTKSYMVINGDTVYDCNTKR